MLRPPRFTVPTLILLIILLASSATAFAQAVPLITQAVDEGQRVVLRGNTRPEASAANDRGAVADSLPLNGIELLLKRSPEHEQAAATLADDLQLPGSPQFHKWLTADQYAAQFGVHPQDVATISDWLRGHGFTVDDSGPMTITFSGTAGQMKEAFGTEIHALEVKGQRHIANMSDPSIPSALAPAIEGVVSLHDLRPQKQIVPKAQYTIPPSTGVNGSNNVPFYAVAPADLAKIYDFNPLFALGITGQGRTIALIEDSDAYNPRGDWNTFRKTLGLDIYKGASLETIHPGKNCADPGASGFAVGGSGDDEEAIFDAEWASAAAPSANIQLVSCANTTATFGGIFAEQNLLNQHQVPDIISVSYGDCEVGEGTENALDSAIWQQAVLEGVSVFVAAGDSGGADCDNHFVYAPAQSGIAVNGFASTAYNVAVGGTDFGDFYMDGSNPGNYLGNSAHYWSPTNNANYSSALSYVPEIPWNDSCASPLITSYLGYATPYGANGFCATTFGQFLTSVVAGSGGPSNCATGESTLGVIPPTYMGPEPTDGTCRGRKKPVWQNVLGNPNDGVRDLPDVVMFAGDGIWSHAYIFCNSDPTDPYMVTPCVGAPLNWGVVGGTSVASPLMAGIQALVNEVWHDRQGNPDLVYYALAREEYGKNGNKNCDTFATAGPAPTCVFHDITIGDNAVNCVPPYNCYDPDANLGIPGVLSLSDHHYEPAFQAGVGWDFATGLGSVNAFNLVLSPIWLFGSLP